MQPTLASVGVVGTYPMGGYPVQAWYAINGASAPGAGQASPGSSPAAAGLPASGAGLAITLLILLIGAYLLWHFTY